MIDLLEYFDNHVEGTYYERFCTIIQRVDDEGSVVFGLEPSILEYKLYDEVELEDKFRSICQPPDNYTSEDDSWFILISFYFFHHNIYIRQFPKLFERPKSLLDFAYTDIRQYAFDNGYTNGDMSEVKWSIRRQIIRELVFERSIQGVIPNDEIVHLINIIESNDTSWQMMNVDAKLAALNNVIEHELKRDGRFIDIPDIDNIHDFVKCREFRSNTHCMRHGSEEALRNRREFNDSEKQFLVDYGVSLVHLIKRNISEE